jgi:hypothetical protein
MPMDSMVTCDNQIGQRKNPQVAWWAQATLENDCVIPSEGIQ